MRRLHEKLFYRPLLAAVARIPGEGARLSPEAATERMSALGYLDPASALRHLEALTTGVSRTSSIQRTLLPVMLEWFGDAPDPDAGLFGFRRLSEALGATPWYLSTLRDEGEVAQRLAKLLASSRYATDLLEREPQGVKMLGEDLTPLTAEALTEEMASIAGRRDEAEDAIGSIRAVRRRELLRIAAGELTGVTDVAEVGAALARLTDATLEATLAIAGRAVREAAVARRGTDARWRSSRWAATAASSCPTAPTPTCCSCTTRARAPIRRTPAATRWPWPTRYGGCSPCPVPTRRSRSTRGCVPRASRAPSCARSTPTGPTTRSGPGSGRRRRCCAPTRSWATRTSAAASPR